MATRRITEGEAARLVGGAADLKAAITATLPREPGWYTVGHNAKGAAIRHSFTETGRNRFLLSGYAQDGSDINAEPTLFEALDAMGWKRSERVGMGAGRYVIRRASDDSFVCEGTAADVWATIKANTISEAA